MGQMSVRWRRPLFGVSVIRGSTVTIYNIIIIIIMNLLCEMLLCNFHQNEQQGEAETRTDKLTNRSERL